MLLSEFQDFPFGYQIELLFQDGIPLLNRQIGSDYYVLFSFHAYYVEAGWDQCGHLQFIQSFTNLDGLDPYLIQLDWPELV